MEVQVTFIILLAMIFAGILSFRYPIIMVLLFALNSLFILIIFLLLLVFSFWYPEEGIRVANNNYIILLLLVPALIIFYKYAFRKKKEALWRFGNFELLEQLSLSTNKWHQLLKASFLIMATGYIVIALLRPQMGTRLEEVKREGQDIIIALDVSASMLAEDIAPNRLEKAKHEVMKIIDRLEGDRIGLVAFAGAAFVQCPLTLDYGACKIFLDIMDTKLIPRQGTAIGEAIKTAISAFNEKERKHKVLILITDGEDHESEPLKWAESAKLEGIVIYTVGIGSREGVPIPQINENRKQVGFKRDKDEQIVISKLDEVTLEKIALETKGKYYRATPGESELDKIYNAISQMDKKEIASFQFTQFEDQFQIFLFLALYLIVIEFFLPDRKKST